MIRRSLVAPALLLAGVLPCSQTNQQIGLDLRLTDVTDPIVLGRAGIFPDGINGLALETSACNTGTQAIPWRAVMDPDHPFIAFLLARESNGRLVQISDRSDVKHGFFALSVSVCGTCQPTDGTALGVGCGDTYASDNNGDRFWLGPPDEIDPWRGRWEPLCSHFDRGEPPVAPPFDCDGVRSLGFAQTAALGPVEHRVQVADSALAEPGELWAQAMYVIGGEPDVARGDDLGSRALQATWDGLRWNVGMTGPLQLGSVLERWQGAQVGSATNGADDGRLYVAVKVTGPQDGFYHYEYAVHDRDNARGVGAVRVPVCAGARVRAPGSSDVDRDPGNAWTVTRAGDELVFATTQNPLLWNSIYNFWFDSDAAPAPGAVLLDQARPGPGLGSVGVSTSAPLALHSVFLGPGCARGAAPKLFPVGDPPRATLGNASFGLRSTGNAPLQPNLLLFSSLAGQFRLGGCTFYVGPSSTSVLAAGTVLSDASGVAFHPVPIPDDVSLEGRAFSVQLLGRDPGQGALYSNFELSDGLRVRVGDLVPDCP